MNEHPIWQRIEDFLTVLDGRKNDLASSIDAFVSRYPKVAGCGCILGIISPFACILTIAVLERLARAAR